jgi:signal transduction histidine kinase
VSATARRLSRVNRPRPATWLRDHPRTSDALLAALVLILALISHFTVEDPELSRPTWWSPLLVIASIVPLALRRRWPASVLIAVSIPECILQSNEMLGAGFVNVLIAAYSLGAHASPRRVWGAGSAVLACLFGFIVVGMVVDGVSWSALVSVVVLYVAALLLGDNMRRRRERSAELVERAERAERERELLAVQQVQQERTRIAREMHDVVAHGLSVMIIQAGAARRQVRAHPDAAIGALETIEATGREAMSEMRRILGVLRDDDVRSFDGAETGERDHRVDGDPARRSPQPSLAMLPDLVHSASDLPIELRVTGDLSDLPAAVELSAYRVVQEALTNVRRHGGRVDRVSVEVDRSDGTLTVVVDDDGRGAGAVSTEPGFGIIGMRERVGMFSGTLDTGPRRGGGWRVRATFPDDRDRGGPS